MGVKTASFQIPSPGAGLVLATHISKIEHEDRRAARKATAREQEAGWLSLWRVPVG